MAPANEDDAVAIVGRAISKRRPLRIAGGGTRAGLGRPSDAAEAISSARLSGISFYEPAELVIGVKAGTPIADVEAALAENGQMLAFEPMDHRMLYGTSGAPTIGGVAAINASGPRRIRVGAARDALLGARLVNGKGELIRAGGRVMKNVTGLDLPKALCGSYGTLGFLTEVTFKVLPRPERSATLVLPGLADADAIAALASALGSPYEPTGAAHLPAGIGGDNARTFVRIEGFSESVDHRMAALGDRLAKWGTSELIEGAASADLWGTIRNITFLAEPPDHAVWRVSVKPSDGPAVAGEIAARLPGTRWFYDSGGGLIWLAIPASGDAGAGAVRAAIAGRGGHATLVRAPSEIRRTIPVFQPLSAPLMRLTAGVKQSFDPHGLFEPGRMYDGI